MSTARNVNDEPTNQNSLVFFATQASTFTSNASTLYYTILTKIRFFLNYCLNVYNVTFGDGFLYVRGLFIIFFVDALIADDEPIWEPVE